MTSLIQQGRYDALVRRVADLKGPGSKVSEVLTELFPVLEVENLPNELMVLQGTTLGMGDASVQGGVAQNPGVILENPAGSGKIATVTLVVCGSDVIQRYSMGLSSVAAGVPTTAGVRDTRLGINGIPTCTIEPFTNASTPSPNVTFRTLAETDVRLENEKGLFILSPGSGLLVVSSIANSTIEVGFFWRERVVEASELNF